MPYKDPQKEKEYQSKWKLSHPGYFRNWYKNNYIKSSRILLSPEENARHHREFSKRNRDMNPQKVFARKKVFIALRNGTLKRLPCMCGSIEVEAHHPDYKEPMRIVWLCKKHHELLH